MPRQPNPIDQVAQNLAEWAEEISDQAAAAIIGGLSAPFSAQVTEEEKLEYFTRQYFEPDGQPNMTGRASLMAQRGPAEFAEILAEILKAHPEYRSAVPGGVESGEQLMPTSVPGVQEVAPAADEELRPTYVPGVSEVVPA